MKADITVKTSSNSYKTVIGDDILEACLLGYAENRQTDLVFLLIDENVFAHHWNRVEPVLSKHFSQVQHMTVPEGERSKSVRFWRTTVDFLLRNGVRRNTPLLVIGGGVTGDLGGFAAATALRGIPLLHIPTTLLAMVDSSIGGKTGVNHSTGKNLIGSFYQPEMVISDTHFLQTLPQKEWVNGLSEILKYGAIRDEAIFKEAEIFLNSDVQSINQEKLVDLIAKCVKIKADIVEEDEFEGGIRVFLNYGHTFAHALEKACNFDKISHGEAVFLGMLAAQKLSILMGAKVTENKFDIFRLLYSYRITKEELSYKNLAEYMQSDKKRTDEALKFVLLEDWQHPAVKTVTNEGFIQQAWDIVFNEL